MRNLRWLFAILVAVAFAPLAVLAQEPATVTGRVTNASGAPENAVLVRIDALGVGTTTAADGTFRLVIPASRVRAGQQVTITASRVGLASQSRAVTLSPGANLTQNFQLGSDALQLETIVATGQGTETTRARATATVNTVSSQEITESRESNVVAALAGKAPNVLVTSSSGDPGAGAYIQIRGAASVVGGTQPLFVVDGTPIDNSTVAIEATTAGTALTNRAADINPNDIADIQILKGGAATALYGSRGANGVVLITTRSGRAGQTRISFSSTYSADEVNRFVPLQTQYGLGLNAAPLGGGVDELYPLAVVQSWGTPIAAGTPVYDHSREVFDDGSRFENNLTLSGGSDRTTYYMSVGRTDHDGVIVGPQAYDRTTLRLKGTHNFSEDFTIGGNVAYTKGQGDFVQQGSNISGILLGALRTPATYNNLPYISETTGLHRSYRCELFSATCPTTLSASRGFDNPFWVANELTNEANVNRTFGNINLDYAPANWLRFSYILGADYSIDERRSVYPKSSSDFPQGRMVRADLTNFLIESRFLATLSRTFSDNVLGTLSLGQSLNQSQFSRYQVNGQNLIYGADQLDYAVDKTPNEFESTTRSDGYFANGELTLFDQLTLTGNVLYEGSSTFGGDGERFVYPGVGFSWQVSRLPAFDNISFVDLFKVRANWGVSGRQPPVYSDETGFGRGGFGDGWISNGFNSIYGGQDGVVSSFTLGNPDIKPERKEEWEAGFDIGVLGGRAALGFTYYDRTTTDMILGVQLPYSTGFGAQFQNAARVDNDGIELTLDLNPIQREAFSWTVNGQYARNRSCVKELAVDNVGLNGFTGSTVSIVSPEVTGECQPFGVFYGDDFIRFGRGSFDQYIDGADIDETYTGWQPGDIYIDETGFPQDDPSYRVVGDPNPDWTGSVRNTFTLFNNLRVSGLIDISQGGQVWNGTKGALTYYGTHRSTLPFQGEGIVGATFAEVYPEFAGEVAGPGVDVETDWNWLTWTWNYIGSGFTGPMTLDLEDASWVKLRDVSVSYTMDQPWLKRRFGLSSVNFTVSGRNLKTWTDYSGIDPESNLTGQSVGRGLDYFNNPQTRSWVFSVNLNR